MDPKKLVTKELDLDVAKSAEIDELYEEYEDRADDLLVGGCRGRQCYTIIDKL